MTQPLELYANGQKVSTLRLEATIGRAHVSRVHADARFFGSEQFRLKPAGDGWVILPVSGTVNATVVNDTPLVGPQVVRNGMTVKVRGASGLVLELRLPIVAAGVPSRMSTAVVPVSPISASDTHEAPRSSAMPGANLRAASVRLEDTLNRIEANRVEAQRHRSNAILAYVGAAIAYLLTSGSSRRMVRTAGAAAAVGGVVYGGSEGDVASSVDVQNNRLLDSALSLLELEGVSGLRSEGRADVKRRFMELVLRLGGCVDSVMKEQGDRMKNMSLLGRRNQQLALSALNVDIISNRFRMNRIYSQIDPTKVFPDCGSEFSRRISGIDSGKVQQEGLYSKVITGGCFVLGILLAGDIQPLRRLTAMKTRCGMAA